MAKQKELKAYIKNGLIQARVDQEQTSTIVNKAILYCKGNVAAYVREACLNYKPVKKVLK